MPVGSAPVVVKTMGVSAASPWPVHVTTAGVAHRAGGDHRVGEHHRLDDVGGAARDRHAASVVKACAPFITARIWRWVFWVAAAVRSVWIAIALRPARRSACIAATEATSA